MDAQTAFQNKLRENFYKSKNLYPSYSLRAFAKKIGLSPGELSEIISGRRVVSIRKAQQVVQRLNISLEEKLEILDLFKSSSGIERPSLNFSIVAEQFKLISSYEHLAILSLFKTYGFKSDSNWISDRLGISPRKTEDALKRLEKLNLIDRTKRVWVRTTASIQTTDEVVDQAVQAAHIEELEMAKASLEKVAVEDRDITSVTMAINPQKMSEAKKLIRNFQNQMEAVLETHPNTEVYKLCIQFFPVTQILRGKNEQI